MNIQNKFNDYDFSFNNLQSLVDQLHKNKVPNVDTMIITIEQYMIKADNLIRFLDEAFTALEDDKK